MRYIKDGKVITASAKAYKAVYKEQGYAFYTEETAPEEAEEMVPEEEITDISVLNVTQLKALAKERGIEGASSLTKGELLEVLKEVIQCE